MLEYLRKWAGGWVAGIFILLLAGSFAVFGVGDMLQGSRNTTVAEIGEITISAPQFRNEFQSELSRIARSGGQSLTTEQAREAGMDDAILNRMVSRAALDSVAQDLGLTAPDEAIAQSIRTTPSFQDLSGKFDRGTYEQVLQRAGLTDQGYSQSIRSGLVRDQIVQAVTTGIVAPTSLTTRLYEYLMETRDVEYLSVAPDAADPDAMPEEERVSKFYGENLALFMAPEYRDVTLLTVSAEDLLPRIDISEVDLKAAYEEQIDQYRTPAKRTVAQLLFPDQEAARAAADKLRAATDIDAVLAELGFSAADVTLGEIEQRALAPAAGEAVFALEEGAVSDPVGTAFGWGVYRATGLKPEVTQPFEDVQGAVRRQIGLDRATNQLFDLQNEIEDQRATGTPLDEIAAALELVLQSEKAVNSRGFTPEGTRAEGLFRIPEVMAQVFSVQVGSEEPIQETDDGNVYIIQVNGITPTEQRPLGDVRDSIVDILNADDRRKALEAKTDALITRLNETATFEQVASELGETLRTAEGLARTSGNGVIDGDVLQAVFGVGEGGIIAGQSANSASRLIIRVSKVVTPDSTAEEAQIEARNNNLRSLIETELTDQFIEAVKADKGVDIDPSGLDTAFNLQYNSSYGSR